MIHISSCFYILYINASLLYISTSSTLGGFSYHAILSDAYAYAHTSLPLAAADCKRRGAHAESALCKEHANLRCHTFMCESVVAQPFSAFAFCELPCGGLFGITCSFEDIEVGVYAVYQTSSDGIF